MSYALKLLVMPGRYVLAENIWYPHTVLDLDTSYPIIGQLCDVEVSREGIPPKPVIPSMPLPPLTKIAYPSGKQQEDPYGQPLRWLFANELKALKVPRDATWMNKAIKAFIDRMPPDLPIVLYPN